MMRLKAVAAGCVFSVSRRHVTSASAAHGHMAVSRTIHTASSGFLFHQPTELVKIPEDALQELGHGIER
jgi:hypothetical protein